MHHIYVLYFLDTLKLHSHTILWYYLYDIPSGETRGGHAHRELYQLIVAASGSFNVLLDDGSNKKIT